MEFHDQQVQTEIDLVSFREIVSQRTAEDVMEEEEEEEVWMDLSEMNPEMFEEHEFSFVPIEGETLHIYNERKVFQAEMSSKSAAVLDANR